MKKLLLCFAITANLFADSFNYYGVGIYPPITPSFVVGHRKKSQDNKGAIDLSARISTVNFGTCAFSGNLSYLGYFGEKNYYLGGGAAFGIAVPTCDSVTPSITVYMTPSITLGKENTHSFTQMHIGLLFHSQQGPGIPNIPVIGLEYGKKF